MSKLNVSLAGHRTAAKVTTAIVAGWAGRDRAALARHLAELIEIGVPRPTSTPLFYRVSTSRLTTASEIEAPADSSGEVEPVLFNDGANLWVGVGSDHTDREVEKYSVAVSKQMCDKPLARELWAYEEVAPHWDHLVLRSWIGDEVLYQEEALKALLPPEELLSLAQPRVEDGTLIFCGTVPTIGGVRPAERFRYELSDPVLGRTIGGSYAIRQLPLVA